MTYNVFSGTLNPTQSINLSQKAVCISRLSGLCVPTVSLALRAEYCIVGTKISKYKLLSILYDMANKTEPSACCDDAALCESTLTTCYNFINTT